MHYFQGSREHRPPWGPHSYKRLGDFFNVGYIVCVEGGGGGLMWAIFAKMSVFTQNKK